MSILVLVKISLIAQYRVCIVYRTSINAMNFIPKYFKDSLFVARIQHFVRIETMNDTFQRKLYLMVLHYQINRLNSLVLPRIMVCVNNIHRK